VIGEHRELFLSLGFTAELTSCSSTVVFSMTKGNCLYLIWHLLTLKETEVELPMRKALHG